MEKLAQDINSLRSMEGTHDFKLRVKINSGEAADAYKVIPVHKFVLLARSPVLCAMLKSNMLESKQKFMKIVDSTPEAIETLVEFMYSGKAECGSIQHGMDVCTAADKYGVDDLVTLCEEYLVAQTTGGGSLAKQQFQALFELAELCDLAGLERACVVFLLRWKNWLVANWNYPYFLSHSQCQKVLFFDSKPARDPDEEISATSTNADNDPPLSDDDYF